MNRLRTTLAVLVCLGVSHVLADSSLRMASIKPYRADARQLAFRIEFEGRPDPARLRIMLDVDGPGRGEPTSGADYMLEGVSFYRYPTGVTVWQWEAIGPPLIITKDNTLTCVLPEAFHADSVRWYAETTDTNWATADRFPKAGFAEFKLQSLPMLPTKEFTHKVASPALQIMDVSPFKIADSGLAFRIAFAAKPEIARLRIMFGDGYMVEGATFYKRPEGATGWTWQPVGSPIYLEETNTLTCILLDALAVRQLKWYVETTTTNWETADRIPPIGWNNLDYDKLPALKIGKRPETVDLRELTAHSPRSLSVRFNDEFKKLDWKKADHTLPVQVTLADVVSGESATLAPESAFESGPLKSWKGRTLGVEWMLVADGDTVTGQLEDSRDRCLRVSAGRELDVRGWMWHDDVRFRRDITAGQYANLAGSLYGATGQQSLYPFAVISSNATTWIVETDPDEPRVVQLVADADKKFFGASYDLALTQQTKKFPGQATFRCSFRKGTGDFRHALADFYSRHPDFVKRRVPQSGLWMPFFDVSKLPDAEDFGFAFLEKEGVRGADVDYAQKHGILALGYTEPWLYWLPMPAGTPRNETEAERLMKLLSETGDKKPNQFAASALTGAARRSDDSVRMQFLDVPWNSGARMEVSTDPDLPGFNRAMAEWRAIKHTLDDEHLDGIYLDSMQAPSVADYNPAAIAAADYPCTFEMSVLKPALSSRIAAYEFTAALGRYLHANGKFLMGNFPCWDFPFYMPFIDIPGEETSWLSAGRYQPLSDAALNYRRAMSGEKPFGFLQATRFEDFKGEIVERYFRDCMFWAFQPSFFSHDGANDPYWLNPKWFERDRPLFKKYVPLIRRLADAGWRPVGPVSAADERLWIEHFGDRHITMRNTTPAVLTTELRGDGVLVNPLTGQVEKLPCRVSLAPHAVETCDIVSNIDEEIAFLQSWKSPTGEAEASLRNLKSLDTKLMYSMPAIRGEPNRLIVGVVTQTFTEADLDTNGWLTAGGRTFRPLFIAPVEVSADDERVVARGAATTVKLSLKNHSTRQRALRIAWDGDYQTNEQRVALQPSALQTFALPVEANEKRRGYVGVTVRDGDAEVFRQRFYVLFVDENASLARDSRVTVTADSTFAGYNVKALTDGVTDTTALPWNEAAWASDESGQGHFVKIVFPEPVTARELKAYWNVEQGVTYTSRAGEVRGWASDGKEVTLGKFTNDAAVPVTTVSFEPVKIKAIQLSQPAGAGSKERPSLLWLAEIELR